MRCKKHPADVSGTVGVCASCLRERLFAIIAVQAQQDCRKSDSQQPPPPISFPRSVSPYISRRKSDTAADGATWQLNGHQQRFHSTPLVLPTVEGKRNSGNKKSNGSRFSSLFRNLFRSKSDLDSDPSSRSADSISPSWLSTIIPGRRKKQTRTFSLDEGLANRTNRRTRRDFDRGMSPARFSDEEEDDEHCHGGGLSGYESESSQGWKQTPRRTPAAMRRGGTANHNMNITGLAFCLSPLVRPSPNRHWNQKNILPETVMAGESRVPAKPRLSVATSFCKNRSRKLADIGRYNNNNNY